MKAIHGLIELVMCIRILGWRNGRRYWNIQRVMCDPSKCRAFIARLRAAAAVTSDITESACYQAFADETERRLNIIEGGK